MPKITSAGRPPQPEPSQVPKEIRAFSTRVEGLRVALGTEITDATGEQNDVFSELKTLLKDGEQFLEHPKQEVRGVFCTLYRKLEKVLAQRPAGDLSRTQLPLVRTHLKAAGREKAEPLKAAELAVGVREALGLPGRADGTSGPRIESPQVASPGTEGGVPALPEEFDGPPSADERLTEAVNQLTTQFSSLEPSRQGECIKEIGLTLAELGASLESGASPGELEVFDRELKTLVASPVGVLRLFDRKTRHEVKQAFTTLSQSEDPRLAGMGKLGLSHMVPEYGRDDISAAEAEGLLASAKDGNFVVRLQPFPKEEYCVSLKTPGGVRHYSVFESSAANGAVLYTFNGITHYTNFSTLVLKELKTKRGFALLGESPDNALVEKAQEIFIQPGIKYRKTRINNVKVSHIKGGEGREYIISNTVHRGSFGKFRYALDEEGKRWAVKEFRSEYARHKSNPKTAVTNMEAILAEIEVMAKVGGDFAIRDSINIKGKVYALMPIMEGEMGDHVQNIPEKERSVVARSVFRQMATDLLRCQRKGFIHRDVKPGNVLWSDKGKVVVSDYGLAVPKPKLGERLQASAGTLCYMAPEMFEEYGYGVKADVWSLGVSVAEVLVDWDESPFFPPRGVAPREWCAENFRQYGKWREEVTGTGGKISIEEVGKKSTPFDRYFKRLNSVDSALCEYLLNKVLTKEAIHRAMLRDIVRFSEGLQGAKSLGEVRAQKTFATMAGESDDRDQVFDLLENERRASKS